MSRDVLNVARYEVKNGCIAKVWQNGTFSLVLTQPLDELSTRILCDELNSILLSVKTDYAIQDALSDENEDAPDNE